MASTKSEKVETKLNVDVGERIAAALEQMVEKLSNIEIKIEELTYELQAHGNLLADAVGVLPEEEMEMGCGTGCGAGDQSAQFIQIEK